MAVASPSDIIRHGFPPQDNIDEETYEQFLSKYVQILIRRALRWNIIIKSNDGISYSTRVKRFIRKGIPNDSRSLVWLSVSGAYTKMVENPDRYKSLLEEPRDDRLVETIQLDIHRTFPENAFFSRELEDNKLDSLFNVLIAFAQQNRNIGYCQGLNYIAGVMLLIINDEEQTFWLFKTLLDDILPDYHSKEMIGLLTDIDVLGELIKIKAPLVTEVMQKYGVTWPIVITKWLICLFIDVLPIETVLRIWDSLFYERTKIIFRVIVTLVMKNQRAIISCSSFPEIVETFKNIVKDSVTLDCHKFMKNIFKVPGSFPLEKITQLRQQCKENILEQQSSKN